MDFKLNKSNLNFRVYTAPSTPATGAENDVVVFSDVKMKNWVLSPDSPSGAPRTDGDVWLKYSVSGDCFNAVKGNSFFLSIIGAFQYSNGTWVQKDAAMRINGEWVEVGTFIVKNGVLKDDAITTFIPSNTITQKDGYVEFAGVANYLAIFTMTAPVDLTEVREIGIEIPLGKALYYGGTSPVLCVGKKRPDSTSSSVVNVINLDKYVYLKQGTSDITEVNMENVRVTLDVSSLSGDYYIGFVLGCPGTSKGYYNVKNFWYK